MSAQYLRGACVSAMWRTAEGELRSGARCQVISHEARGTSDQDRLAADCGAVQGAGSSSAFLVNPRCGSYRSALAVQRGGQ